MTLPPHPIRAFAFDLDGTLVNSDKQLTPATKQAIARAAAFGLKLILASGRPSEGMFPLADELALATTGGYVLAYNGGRITDYRQQTVIYEQLLPTQYHAQILALSKEFGLVANTYQNGRILTTDATNPYVRYEQQCTAMEVVQPDNLLAAITGDVPKFLVVGDPAKTAAAIDSFKATLGEGVNVFFSEPFFLEVTPQGIDKGTSLSRLCQHLGLTMADVCAFGDGMNDLTMLQQAGYSVAMANASDQVKQHAQTVTLNTNDNDGVAEFINAYVDAEQDFGKI